MNEPYLTRADFTSLDTTSWRRLDEIRGRSPHGQRSFRLHEVVGRCGCGQSRGSWR